jgi:hypothetical protein
MRDREDRIRERVEWRGARESEIYEIFKRAAADESHSPRVRAMYASELGKLAVWAKVEAGGMPTAEDLAAVIAESMARPIEKWSRMWGLPHSGSMTRDERFDWRSGARFTFDADVARQVLKLAAVGEPAAVKAVKDLVRDYVSLGKDLPPTLAAHLLQHYGKPLPRPREKDKHEERDTGICFALQICEYAGLTIHRRPNQKRGTPSGAALVVEALGLLGIRIGERAVEKVWEENRRLLAELEAEVVEAGID